MKDLATEILLVRHDDARVTLQHVCISRMAASRPRSFAIFAYCGRLLAGI